MRGASWTFFFAGGASPDFDLKRSDDDMAWVLRDEEASSWEGDVVSRAWLLLQTYLDRHDDKGEYRPVVLDAILEADQTARLPRWLVASFMVSSPARFIWTWFFFNSEAKLFSQDSNPDRLIRALVRNNRLIDAFNHTLAIIKRSAKPVSISSVDHSAALLLPWAIFDELLSVDLSEDPERSALEPLQKELRTGVEQRLATAERASRSLLAKAGR
jgi:hypothetical protein